MLYALKRESYQVALLSSKLALVQTGAQPGQWGCRAGAPLSLAAFLGISFACSVPTSKAITQIGGTDPQMDTLYIVRFFTWRKSICIKMIIPREASLWPSVTFSPLEIVLSSLLKKKKSFRSEGASGVIICHFSKKSLCQAIYMLIACGLGRKRMLPGS